MAQKRQRPVESGRRLRKPVRLLAAEATADRGVEVQQQPRRAGKRRAHTCVVREVGRKQRATAVGKQQKDPSRQPYAG